MRKTTQKPHHSTFLLVLIGLILVFATFSIPYMMTSSNEIVDDDTTTPVIDTTYSIASVTRKARASYFQRLLRDPATGQIPPGIRKRELDFARQIPRSNSVSAQKNGGTAVLWEEAGPYDVGGRTRALAVDRTNSNVILAGGVAGGIWKSTDKGESWELKSDPTSLTGVSYITQDPRPGSSTSWYAVTGEFLGSNGDRGRRAPVYGQGLYTSLDNGESWTLVASSKNPTILDSPFDLGLKVLVSPTTGTIFVASQAFGLNRIPTPESPHTQILGTRILPEWTDFDIASDGNLIAVTSEGLVNTNTESPGVFYSTDDGITWQDITPTNFPVAPARSVVTFAPSDPTLAYLWTFTGQTTPDNNAFGEEEIMKFYAFSLPSGTSEDRSVNLPDFGGQVGHLYTQGSYDMVIAVKPDDPEDVFIGGTNLYRSRDGFTTPANNIARNWIGGYAIVNNLTEYNNHHPDLHALFFDPQNPNALWSGHDGGLSFVEDVSPVLNTMPWEDKNNGYNVTQFYHVTMAKEANDPRIMGGTQDNGSVYFTYDPALQEASDSRRVSSADGGYAYLGQSYAISSMQLGQLVRLSYNTSGTPLFAGDLTPPGATNQLFVTPFAVDLIDESVVYYLAGSTLWRGRSIPLAASWSSLSDVTLPFGYVFTALAAGILNVNDLPSSTLYLAASGNGQEPRLFRMDNATTSREAPVDISISAFPPDAYIHTIATHPEDGSELLVVASNYNVVGLYHSTDAGATFTPVEGNLTGDADTPGPSLHTATILPSESGTLYLLGTSTGVYSTTSLEGEHTVWTHEGAAEIGNTIVESITSRPSDGRIAVGTHGRGIFIGTPQNSVSIDESSFTPPHPFSLAQNYPNPFSTSTTIRYTVNTSSQVHLEVFDITGRRVKTLVQNKIQPPGTYTVDFNSGTLSSGMYIYELKVIALRSTSPAYTTSRTMVISR